MCLLSSRNLSIAQPGLTSLSLSLAVNTRLEGSENVNRCTFVLRPDRPDVLKWWCSMKESTPRSIMFSQRWLWVLFLWYNIVLSVENDRNFGGICRVHLQNKRLSQTVLATASRWFLAWLIIRPWRWKLHVPPKLWLTFKWLHCVLSEKIELFETSMFLLRFKQE
jgi:hypothetical protein